jgi:predicted nucleic acid-binding protein
VILADTSVWIDHLRWKNVRLAGLLAEAQVSCHPFVIGELALGNLRRGSEILELLASLPQMAPAAHAEVLRFVEEQALAGSGLGWVDVHLLCAAARARTPIWTFDRRLAGAAMRLGLAG